MTKKVTKKGGVRGTKKTPLRGVAKKNLAQKSVAPKKTKSTKKNTKSATLTKKHRTVVKRKSLVQKVLLPHRVPYASTKMDTFAIQTARIGGLTIVALGGFFTLLFSQYIWNIPLPVQMQANALQTCDISMDQVTYDACMQHNLNLYSGTSQTITGSYSSVYTGSTAQTTSVASADSSSGTNSSTTSQVSSTATAIATAGSGTSASSQTVGVTTITSSSGTNSSTTSQASTIASATAGSGTSASSQTVGVTTVTSSSGTNSSTISQASTTASATAGSGTSASSQTVGVTTITSSSGTNSSTTSQTSTTSTATASLGTLSTSNLDTSSGLLLSGITQPPVTFRIAASEPLKNTVDIYLDVQNANIVEVSVFQDAYTNVVALGRATQVQPNIWLYKWDTTKFPDGSYKIIADVTNVYTVNNKPYRGRDGKYLQVNNTSVASPTSPVPLNVPSITATQPTAKISVIPNTTGALFQKFTVQAQNALSVIVYAQEKSSQTPRLLGIATKTTSTDWRYTWNTFMYIPGTYVVYAQVQDASGTYQSNTVQVTLFQTSTTNNTVDSVASIPQPILTLPNVKVLSDIIDVSITIPEAEYVELWAVPDGSTIENIVGLAKKDAYLSDTWLYTWNTRQIPNGDYDLFAKVKNRYGLYSGVKKKISIFNAPFDAQATQIQQEQNQKIDEGKAYETSITIPEDTDTEHIPTALSKELDSELQRLTIAYRSNDPALIDIAEQRIEKIKNEILKNFSKSNKDNGDVTLLQTKVDEKITDYKERSKKIEKLISERVGTEVFKDSDSDGVTDYDEKTLYKTDPYSADSDGDGFNDGIEISNGYNPLDSKQEAVRVFESPKKEGVKREDLLVVESITPIVSEDPQEDPDGVSAQAVITGRGLPNSFVTLYIFSLPTIVTVKTEADGSWKYRFDKELEDGNHEIYVGVTDNAGRIVAKSAAFRFVKEAQAFTPEDAATLGVATTDNGTSNRLLSTFMVYLILSISVVSIGLVLILLGLHLDTRRKLAGEILRADE